VIRVVWALVHPRLATSHALPPSTRFCRTHCTQTAAEGLPCGAAMQDGGRTGVTAMVVCALFFVALFFSPILASIPPFAIGPALVLVGRPATAAGNGALLL
jgi:xanthine/uracil/vitamin C permease (AzgA family)